MATVRELLKAGRRRLSPLGEAALESEILLAHALGVSRAWLFAHPDDPVAAPDSTRFTNLVDRRSDGEPVAYITGQREFWSLTLEVSPAVLIPRPETETLVEAALAQIPPGRALRIADLGTGSGAIALALASERPLCEVHACDRSAEALGLARKNAQRLGNGRVTFHLGSWFEALEGRFDVVVSNPPYVAEQDPHLQQGDARFEPLEARAGGADGLDAIRAIAKAAPQSLNPRGWLMIEHGYDQSDRCREILTHAGFTSVETLCDLEGTKRVTQGQQA